MLIFDCKYRKNFQESFLWMEEMMVWMTNIFRIIQFPGNPEHRFAARLHYLCIQIGRMTMVMDMQIKMNPAFGEFEQMLVKVPRDEVNYEQVYEDGRNFVGRISVGGKSFVVKRYVNVPLIKKALYSTILKSKAQQAYEKADYLLWQGIETAPPVAYIVVHRMGFYHTSYFISEYLPYIPFRRMWKLVKVPREHDMLTKGYTAFRRLLAEKGITITDSNPDNTLVYKRDDGYHFAQIDINRIKINGWYYCFKRTRR